jgi:translation initiation factor eIF-2B subunit alpha
MSKLSSLSPPEASSSISPVNPQQQVQPQSVIKYFEEYVCQSPELSVPVAAIKALTRHIDHSPATTMTEFTKELEVATAQLLRATNQCIAVAAGCDLFRRFVNRTGSDTNEDLAAFRTRLIEKGALFVDKAPQVRDKIAIYALEFIQDDSVIMIHSYSRVV